MAQPAVSVGEDRTDLIGVPAFGPKPTTEPLFTWESWIGQFFLAVNLREHCNANILLSEPAEVQAKIRKTNEINNERRKKDQKSAQMCILLPILDSCKATLTQTSQLSVSATFIIIARHLSKVTKTI